jgi:hypothetical protein
MLGLNTKIECRGGCFVLCVCVCVCSWRKYAINIDVDDDPGFACMHHSFPFSPYLIIPLSSAIESNTTKYASSQQTYYNTMSCRGVNMP